MQVDCRLHNAWRRTCRLRSGALLVGVAGRRNNISRRPLLSAGGAADKALYVEPFSKEAVTAALECGISTLVFRANAAETQAKEWMGLGRSRQLIIDDASMALTDADSGTQVGRVQVVSGPADVKALEAAAAAGKLQGDVIVEAAGWKIIPAENLVAILQALPSSAGAAKGCRLFVSVGTADDGLAMLEALEAGTDGVLLRTRDGAEVRKLAAAVHELQQGTRQKVPLEAVRVTRVQQVGSGDRACVDLACLMQPGEGLLVGSLAAGLFLVHSECEESQYINARPFRVNAGPVHAYVQAPGGRTAYLCELRSGSQVQVVDAAGRQRAALVGRVKVESRPLVLVEAVAASGQHLSILLQNAETVKLVGPAHATAAAATTTTPAATAATATIPLGDVHSQNLQESLLRSDGVVGDGAASWSGRSGAGWRAFSVSQLCEGDEVFAHLQQGARHTGIAIKEFILEK